jgi:hyperosmotically inducible protein
MKIISSKRKLLLACLMSMAPLSVLANLPTDEAITSEVKSKLAAERDIPANSIEVTTKDGVVRLKGTIDTHLQAHKALEIASSVENVTDVVDADLTIKHSKSMLTDASITAKVKGKIRYLYINKKISDGYDLHVETTDQVVHIFGEVSRAMDTETITSAAKNVSGVKNVKTNIKVAPR